MGRLAPGGYPADVYYLRRFIQAIKDLLPMCLMEALLDRMFNSRTNHVMYSLKPNDGGVLYSGGGIVNDDLPMQLASGRVIIKSNLCRMTETTAIFDDGSMAERIDAVIYSTGYNLSFPFLKHQNEYRVENGRLNLYKHVFAPDVFPPTLAVIGCVSQLGPFMSIAEMQCRWATRVFSVSNFFRKLLWRHLADKCCYPWFTISIKSLA